MTTTPCTAAELQRLVEAAAANVDATLFSLESLCICFPSRLSGSQTLEHALDFLRDSGRRDLSLEQVKEEVVGKVPSWERGNWREEYCTVNIIPKEGAFPTPFPLEREMRVLANGLSIGTGHMEGGIVKGEVCFCASMAELAQLGKEEKVRGKIVIFDYKRYIDYGSHNSLRRYGPREASKYGALAALIRSIAPDSTTSGVHTGSQMPCDPSAVDEPQPIPAACMAVEDVELLSRLAARGHTLNVSLKLPCTQGVDKTSRNIVMEIPGSDLAHQIVIVGGHTDSWDCQMQGCQGAHDDGQGVILSMDIVKLIHKLGLKPRRTIRAVLFVDEEVSQSGANGYADAHAEEAKSNIVAAIETDMGVGPVAGFGFSGTPAARAMLSAMLQPLQEVIGTGANVTQVNEAWSGHGVDISPLIDRYNVPGMLLRHEDAWWNGEYFHFHHTLSDTIDHVDIEKLKLNFQILLGTVWILANSDETLPR